MMSHLDIPHVEAHPRDPLAHTNWLRAAVLGANDGVVSIAALVVGVAGASAGSHAVLVAGIAGLLAGAFAMAVGEYVSVSSQLDTETVLLEKERWELENQPEYELAELAHIYKEKGLSKETAQKVAEELMAHDAFAAHVEAELGIDPEDLTNPLQAGIASAISFIAGAMFPLLVITLSPETIRVPLTFVTVAIALAITGFVSARISGAGVVRVMSRVVIGGLIAMFITFGIGNMFGVSGV